MAMKRRDFLGTALAAGIGAAASPLRAQDEGRGGRGSTPPPAYQAKVEQLFKSPDRYPNALEAMPDALWVGDQVSERVLKMDWNTGKVLENFIAEAHNTSGLAVGGGYLWIGCNGAGTAASLRKFDRPTDKSYGEVVQCDMKTGKQVKGYRTPWGGTHGTVYDRSNDKLWVVAPGQGLALQTDPKDNFRMLKMVTIGGGTPHGIELYDGALWILCAADRVLHKHDMESGRILASWTISTNDPDPHGLCIRDGYAYYCDAGLGGGRTPSPGTVPQMICRFPLKTA
jgi:hypothetical protein